MERLHVLALPVNGPMSDQAASLSTPWIFGYGSLMWRPGFAFQARRKAHLAGYERAFCRYSFRHRGTPDKPGLVIGLRKTGGDGAGTGSAGRGCVGIALQPEAASLPDALSYLDEREGAGYHRILQRITFLDGRTPHAGEAWVYVPNTQHPSYFGQHDPKTIVELILQGSGESGTAYDYLVAMLQELHAMGAVEPELESIRRAVEAARSAQASVA